MLEGAGTDKDRGQVGHEGSTGVHKHPDEDGNHGEGQHIDVEDAVADHQTGDGCEDNDEGIEHSRGTCFLEVVLAEEGEEDGEAGDDDCDIENLPEDGQ